MKKQITKQRSVDLDFDEEARALWARLNLDYESRNKGAWNPLDPIWRHPTGLIIYFECVKGK
jgi:hypothetical protein